MLESTNHHTSIKDLLRECNHEPGVKERLFPIEADSKPYKVKRRVDVDKEIANLKRKI